MRKYSNGFYYGQKVVCVKDDGPSLRSGYPGKNAIGTVTNWDPWDRTLMIEWEAGTFDALFHSESDKGKILSTWTKQDYVEPYRPEPDRSYDGHRICAFCGAIVEDDSAEMTWIDGIGWVEKSCVDTHFEVCDICGDLTPKDNLRELDVHTGPYTSTRKKVCISCLDSESYFFVCSDCGEWFDSYVHDPKETTSGMIICDLCAEEYALCPECGRYIRPDDLVSVAFFDEEVCPSCAEKAKQKAIRNYGYKPRPKFKVGHRHDHFETDADIKEILMGVELEVDKGRNDLDCANEIISACEDVYCKHDGSLTCGIEIVSHPATLEYHLTELGWDKISQICRQYGFKSHEAKTCGLHVHVGRRQLGSNDAERDRTAANLVLAMYRHWENMVKFSRRLDSQLNWAERNEPDVQYAQSNRDLVEAALATEDEGRYQAVNLCNSDTVEFRIFRGTLEVNTIKATLELVQNFCDYCKEHTAFEVMNSQWEDIVYLKTYPELYDYLAERKLGNGQMGMFEALPAYSFYVDNDTTYNRRYCYAYDDEHPYVDASVLGNNTDNDVEDFAIGDYVLVTNRSVDYDTNAPIGRIGRVVHLQPGGVGVNFLSGFYSSHALHGVLNSNTGYYVRPYHLIHCEAPTSFEIWAPNMEEEHDDLSHLADPAVIQTATSTMTYTIGEPITIRDAELVF